MTLKTDYLNLQELIKEVEALPSEAALLQEGDAKFTTMNTLDMLVSATMRLIWENKVLNKENYEDLRDSKTLRYGNRLKLLSEILYKAQEKMISSDPSLGSPSIRIESDPKCLICILVTPPDDFYIKLINEINILYYNNRYVPTCILLRKLFENLIIDILRKKYGAADNGLYFNTSRKMFLGFSVLLDNLKNKIEDFNHIDPNFNEDIIKRIDFYRKRCNLSAHSISFEITKDTIDDKKDDINYLITLLIRIRNNI